VVIKQSWSECGLVGQNLSPGFGKGSGDIVIAVITGGQSLAGVSKSSLPGSGLSCGGSAVPWGGFLHPPCKDVIISPVLPGFQGGCKRSARTAWTKTDAKWRQGCQAFSCFSFIHGPSQESVLFSKNSF
jgi:hypothetical protein